MKRFPDNARVCFVGDSITHANLFVAHIAAYYREHFPEAGVEFYNCGVSGGTLTTILNAFDEDTRIYEPTHAVLMIGINDSGIGTLNNPDENKYQKFKALYDNYKVNLDKLCHKFMEMGAELTLCTPMPYAEYSKSDVPPWRGGSALLLGYAEFIKKYAKENGYAVCDYHSYATCIMQNEDLYDAGRVHPNSRGHYYMAKCFLEFQGFDLGEEKKLPADIREWHAVVARVRDTIAAEHFILNDDFTTTQEERMTAIKDYFEKEQTGPYVNYFKLLAGKYLSEKAKQEENIKFLMDFMKNQ